VTCGDILAPVDKEHRLAPDCAPPDLVTLPGEQVAAAGQQMRAAAAAAFGELFTAALSEGYTVLAASAYRSYQLQVIVYGDHVARLGVAAADRISARPGHSEHQMGTTTDVTSPSAGFTLGGFEGTPEAAWLAANSWRFGFIVSYPAGKEEVTGYSYEPWHIRWIGKSEAAQVHASGSTLHEWLLR
jgi:D-alanyl-D-alanine carboxypeptidase